MTSFSYHIDLPKALRPYRIAEKSDATMLLQLTPAVYYEMIAMFSICAVAAFFLRQKLALWPQDALILVVLFLLVLFVLARATLIRNPITINVQKGLLTLRYRKFLGSVEEVIYDSPKIRGLQPVLVTNFRGRSIAGVRVLLADTNESTLYFSRTWFDESFSAQRAELIAHTFSRLLGVRFVPNPRIEAP